MGVVGLVGLDGGWLLVKDTIAIWERFTHCTFVDVYDSLVR